MDGILQRRQKAGERSACQNGEVNTDLDFAVDIPREAKEGEYQIVSKVQGSNDSNEMTLRFPVSAEQMSESSFAADDPSQEGGADPRFSFAATRVNNVLSAQSCSFASNAPSGWQVSFMPSEEAPKRPNWRWMPARAREWMSALRRPGTWKPARRNSIWRRLLPRKR